ncbi:hypothetical protein Leryth_012941 [Lithospermum erythrorhizon]|nr:hypothetical protein Leryth_012941 [Lithospermum erythrorhizon]
MESSSSSAAATTTGGVPERRGIPAAAFVEDKSRDLRDSSSNFLLPFLVHSLSIPDASSVSVGRLQQYRVVEMKLLAQQRDLQAKIPDIEKCLDVVATLQAKKGSGEALITDFEVSEGIYSRARIEDSDSVCLWLGANVINCTELLTAEGNLENAKASLEVLFADLQFLRDQVTITQVTTARVYNWDVHQRRMQQATVSTES